MSPKANYRAVLMNPDGKPYRDRTYNTSAGALYWLLTEIGYHISLDKVTVCPQEEEPGNCDIIMDEDAAMRLDDRWVGVVPADTCLATVRFLGWDSP